MADYDYYKEHQSPSPMPQAGKAVWMYCKIDFSKQNVTTSDNLKIFQVRDKWLLTRGFIRCTTATAGATTLDFGTASGGIELDTAFAANSAGDWLIMDTLKSAGEIALTADGYIWVDIDGANAASGVIEVLIEVVVGPDDGEMDSLAE
jgi:hypothetical protein